MGTIFVDKIKNGGGGATVQVDEIVNVSGDNDSGIDLSTNDEVKINIADSQAVKVTSTQTDIKVSASRELNILKDSGDDALVLRSSAPDASTNLRRIELVGEQVSFATNTSTSTSGTEAMRIDTVQDVQIGSTSTISGSARFCVTETANDDVCQFENTDSSNFSERVILTNSHRSANAAYQFFLGYSGDLSDLEINLRGNGNILADGTVAGGGADYAEYFEWKDGNTSDEDRVGFTVVLDENKIVASSDSDNASDVIGVISGNPVVVGDSAWNKWNQKHLKDDYGRYIWEEYTTTEWNEEVNGANQSVSYETDKIPSDVTVPSDAKVVSEDSTGAKFTRRKLNPDWDESKTYIAREDRKEWDTVGLVGKLRIKKGQKTGTNWIKMRDVSDTVEEWLVR